MYQSQTFCLVPSSILTTYEGLIGAVPYWKQEEVKLREAIGYLPTREARQTRLAPPLVHS